MSAHLRRAPAWTITAAIAVTYLITAPASPDLAAASYRSDLFGHVGFTLWDNSWYGGHNLPAYSLLAPGLGALIGPRLLAACSMLAAAILFERLIAGHFEARATRVAAAWFALGVGIALLSSRVPFDLGLALGLGTLVLVQREKPLAALAPAVLCALASPIAAAFLALALFVWITAGKPPRRPLLILLLSATVLPVAMFELAFPEGGTEPFVASAFWPSLAAMAGVFLAVPARRRVLRAAVGTYGLALGLAFVVPSAIGGNADRLGALVAGPVAVCLLGAGIEHHWQRWLLLALSPALLYWQAIAPAVDFDSAAEDPAVEQSYFRPLLGELRTLDVGYGRRPVRVEVVPTADHWEARWMAISVPIARGWERQLDRDRDALFYGPASRPTPAQYVSWLHAQGISLIALPDTPLDYSGKTEALLLAGPLAGVHEIWRSTHWRLFALARPTPLASRPARLTAMSSDTFTLYAPAAGRYTVKIHFTPFWRPAAAGSGCVARAPGDWTQVRARGRGYVRVVIRFSLARIFARGPRCA